MCVCLQQLTHIAYIYMYKDVGSGLVDRQSRRCSGSDSTICGWNGSALVEGKANLVQMGASPAGVHWSCNLFGHQLTEPVCMRIASAALLCTPPEKLFQSGCWLLSWSLHCHFFVSEWIDFFCFCVSPECSRFMTLFCGSVACCQERYATHFHNAL